MNRKTWWLAAGLLAMLGCTEAANVPSTDTTKPLNPTPAPAPTKPADDKAAAAQPPAASKFNEEELAAIDKLPEADRATAKAQVNCPISGDHLGAMGTPLKVTADGKTAFLCCKGCKDDFEKDPAAALAKLSK